MGVPTKASLFSLSTEKAALLHTILVPLVYHYWLNEESIVKSSLYIEVLAKNFTTNSH